MRRNIVLTGFMATGKTTVGRVLAERLGYELVDTDAVIEERHGPIPQIFAEYGEDEFRRLEREVAAELAQRDGLVISTGGRMLLDPVNAEVLGATGDIVCLTATVDTIVERLDAVGADSRPLLAGHDLRERVTELLGERADGYAAFTQVATDGLTPTEIA
ncbi:MAG: shikimate kinase, partial [Acidimicrobiia bacterium]